MKMKMRKIITICVVALLIGTGFSLNGLVIG